MPRLPAHRSTPEPSAGEIRAPNIGLLLLEARAPAECLALLAAWPWLGRVPRGDGHPVMVYPGLAANDLTTAPLRRFLRRLGYAVQAWGQGMNYGPRAGVLERCSADVEALAARHAQPVSLIGWSLGGIYAREVAKLHPGITRCVVTLGAPFSGPPRATNAWRAYQWLTGSSVDDPEMLRRVREPPPVPTTSIYSRSDGMVAWRCSLNEAGPLAENIAVPASHIGMGVNPLALYAVADRLAQPVGRWQPFAVAGARRWFFRTDDGRAAMAAG